MSQYIRVNQSHTNWQDSSNIVKGFVSKICARDSSSSLLRNQPNRRYMRQKISVREQDEEKQAHLRHNQSLMLNYMKLKHTLLIYGRSKSCKLEEIFGIDESRLSARDSIREAKKLCIKPGKIQRQVVIATKYNHELAIKTAILRQIQQMQELKKKRKEAINQAFERSRSLNINELCKERSNCNKENPVLIASKCAKLRKKKKKILFT